jgi:hypothetical protein
MLACRADEDGLPVLSDLHYMNDRLLACSDRAVLVSEFDDLVIVSILQVVSVLVYSITLLEIFIDHQRVVVGEWVFLEADQASVDDRILLHNRGQHVVASVGRAEAHCILFCLMSIDVPPRSTILIREIINFIDYGWQFQPENEDFNLQGVLQRY